MSRLKWDQPGSRFYETGLDRVVLYVISGRTNYSPGAAWNGVTSIEESISGAEQMPMYADNMKYLSLYSLGDYGLTISAYSSPDEFAECDGSAYATEGVIVTCQPRRSFGLCWRTFIGNDIKFHRYGYKLHFVYLAKASPSEKSHSTKTDSPEPESYSWECSTTPVTVRDYAPTAYAELDCTKLSARNLAFLEDIIYGTANTEARLPSIEELIGIASGNDVISDNKLRSLFDSSGEVIFSSY